MAEWYYRRDNQRFGPVNTSELKRLAACGELLPTDVIWKGGLEAWVPASKAKGLFPVDTASTQIQPPQISQFDNSVSCPHCNKNLANNNSLALMEVACHYCQGLFKMPPVITFSFSDAAQYRKRAKAAGKASSPFAPHEESPLHLAAWHGDLRKINTLIASGVPVDAYEKRHGKTEPNTPLVHAVLNGQYAASRLLLMHGAHPDGSRDRHTLDPIIWAADYGQIEIATLLLAFKAQPHRNPYCAVLNYAIGKHPDGLHQEEMIKILLDAGVVPLENHVEAVLHLRLDWLADLFVKYGIDPLVVENLKRKRNRRLEDEERSKEVHEMFKLGLERIVFYCQPLDFPTLRGRGKGVTGLRRIERVRRSPEPSGYGLGCRTLRCI